MLPISTTVQRRSRLALAIGPLAAVFFTGAQGAEAARQQYHLAPGPLDEVLLSISRQSGQVISFTPQLGNYSSATVDGSLSAEQAVAAALRGTGLQLQVSPDGAFIIKEGPQPVSATGSKAKAQAGEAAAPTLDRVVAIGTRRSDATALTSAAPVDVINSEELVQTGATSLNQALFQLLPSFNFPQNQSATRGQNPKGASLRGLSPDQTLVLINGKRRHASAVVNISGGVPFIGAQPVDLDMIPISAIDHVEVLRDGASAQYGSDAVAGVVNIVLKERDSGGQLNTQLGQYAQGDGFSKSADGWYGLGLPGDGFLTLSFNGLNNKPTDIGDKYEAGGQLQDPRWGGASRDKYNLAANAEIGLSDQWRLYSFATFGQDKSVNNTPPLLASNPNNVASIYPNGTIPKYRYRYEDGALTVGSRYEDERLGRFDLSATYGRDKHDELAFNTVNPSYGANSPTKFDVATLVNEQTNLTLDYAKDLDVAWSEHPLTVSAGVAYRDEQYRLEEGDYASYSFGGIDGVQVGAVQASGLTPDDAGTYKRHVGGVYFGLENQVTDKFQLGLAGRTEHYSDFGSATTGKLSARYDFTPQVGLRATVNNAYRAPTLGQIGTSWTTTTNVDINGNPVLTRMLPADHPAARALGAQPLKPEKSTNYSLGLVLRPSEQASLTIDAYQISIRDRLLYSGGISGPDAERILSEAGFGQYTWAQFMTNAADTRTRGVDIVGKYNLDLQRYGALSLSAGYTKARTTIEKIHSNPFGFDVLTREAQGFLEHGYPEDKLVLGAIHRYGPWTIALSETRYGEYRKYAASAANAQYDQTFSAQWNTDLDVNYAFTRQLRLSVGANNLFDSKPDDFNGRLRQTPGQQYSYLSPSAPEGAFYYTRLSYDF
ncbi:TonB-dependent receptor plug domain-containing protein [Pseudomonas chlororaphis]|uniref:TonB-dependent receptor plug domain-containing protein n=1 Tax=Pseudomonas chlororaphis TaxID=587753 RepID=UPI0009C01429|nr:TonB-dependent receptor [Pseudomonas chlororaphis]QIT24711.1 TonB-dependent receptor [Pseudomonas chlororaphis subsp. aurantiaca]WDH02824.1 TonB-dependent receptor [Pseudomonas chlororaphis]WDH08328.1 TonB-dependent receptor [Pseudomonas chlororaphis]